MVEDVYCTKFPAALMQEESSTGLVAANFSAKVDSALLGANAAFVDELVSYTSHGLPDMTVKQIMEHKVNDKYVVLSSKKEVKKIAPGASSFVGPKRSKFRKLMSSRQRKANGFDELSAKHEKWALYAPMHELWKQYMEGVVGAKTSSKSLAEKSQRFARSDWHGAILQVVKSTSPGLVGVQGILIKETTNTFTIITPQNQYKTIPKHNNVFTTLASKNTLATLYGNHLIIKSSDRSARKFKSKQTIDIGHD